MDRLLSPTGSTPNLTNPSSSYMPHHWSSTNLPTFDSRFDNRYEGHYNVSEGRFNTIAGHGHWHHPAHHHSPRHPPSLLTHRPRTLRLPYCRPPPRTFRLVCRSYPRREVGAGLVGASRTTWADKGPGPLVTKRTPRHIPRTHPSGTSWPTRPNR